MMAETPLIPREVLFAPPAIAQVRISPDGERLAWLAPVDGVLQIWLAPADRPDEAQPVTAEPKRHIRAYQWAYNGSLLYRQDTDGDENWHVFCVRPTGQVVDLTPLAKVNVTILKLSDQKPDEILVRVNDRDPANHDVWQINLETAERQLIVQNDLGFAGFVADDRLQVRFGYRLPADGSMEVLKKTAEGWELFLTFPDEDYLSSDFIGFSSDGRQLYMKDSRGRNTAAAVAIDCESGKTTVLSEDPQADIVGALIQPTTKEIQATWSVYDRLRWQFIDPAVEAEIRHLQTVCNGDLRIQQSLDDQRWVVSYMRDNGPVPFYLYDRQSKEVKFLFSHQPALEGLTLAKMGGLAITTRDGYKMVCYLTIPPQSDSDGDSKPDQPLPMVVNVHGGPWRRDEWGYSAESQFLANRGYAVLGVEFRTSTGFGKNWVDAGRGQWGGKIHDDIVDATKWAVGVGIADLNRIAIIGGSFGGYEVLWAMTHNQDWLFACGIDLCGVSNIVSFLETVPPYWKPEMAMLERMTGGDVNTEAGREFLRSRSPLTFADQINGPLLIVQGANDPRVIKAESDQIVEVMKARDLPAVYLVYPDEGHGLLRTPNRMAYWAVVEAFLTDRLGGRCQPISDDLQKSTVEIVEGQKLIPELAETE